MKKLHDLQDLMLVSSPETQEKINAIKEHIESILSINVETYTMPYDKFADGAYNVEFKEQVSGKNIVVYADCYSDVGNGDLNSKYMFYRHILDAASRNRATTIDIIYPCFPYSRSDKEEDAWGNDISKKVPTMATRVVEDAVRHGVSNLITLDVHNQWVFATTKTPSMNITNLYYKWMIDYAMKDLDKENTEVWSTDLGGTKKIGEFAKVVQLNNYIAYKERDKTKPNSVKELFVEKWFSTITGKDIIVYDDMIDTWWTICELIEKLLIMNPRSIKVVSPHWMFNGSALEKLEKYITSWKVKEIIVSDSITRESLPERITVLKTHKLFGNALISLLNGEEVYRNAA